MANGEGMGKVQLELMLSASTLAAVAEWQVKTGTTSRAAALRELLRRGLAEDEIESKNVDARRR